MAKQNLKPCPFCGKKVTVITDAHDLEECSNFESKNCPCNDYELNACAYNKVVCNVNEGGCGASSGYCPTIEQAIEAWNRRADNGAEVRHGKWRHEDLECSVCRRNISEIYDADSYMAYGIEDELKYCPYCGTKMDLE